MAELHQLYELRAILEPKAAGLAAERIDEDDARALRLLVATPTDARDCAAAVRADARIHLVIAHASGNAQLANVLGNLVERMGPYGHLARHGSEADGEDARQHTRLVDAIISGSRAEAEHLARAHVTWSKAQVVEAIVQSRCAAVRVG